MNQRIQELYRQSLKEVFEYGGVSAKPGEMYSNYKTVLDHEKFAELIVKECMSINTQRLFSDYEGDTHRVAHNNALWCAWGDMKEHFGVDE